MWEVHSSDKIRIKDIAERSGVSVGTVDRVLHNRPNVSGKARAKVETVLKEINYQPNMYASALAYNRKYTFCCLLPDHDRNAYWTSVEKGLQQCIMTSLKVVLLPLPPSAFGIKSRTGWSLSHRISM